MDKTLLAGMGHERSAEVIPTAPEDLVECPYCRGLTHERSKCERCTAPTGYTEHAENYDFIVRQILWRHLSDTNTFFDWGFGITS